MRLWQKIFLLTLVLTTLAVYGISLMLLTRSQKNSLLLAREKAQALCSAAAAELGRLIQEEKESSGHLLMTKAERERVFTEFCRTQEEGIAIRLSEEALLCETLPSGENQGRHTALILGEEAARIEVREPAYWEGRFYYMTLEMDVTELTAGFREELRFCQWVGGAVSLTIAFVLLLSILWLTLPLKRLEAATKRIAAGDYQYRVSVKGHDEIGELSRHMNAMSEEIQRNINQVEETVKNRETFIANMSHELKTPLTSILGFADILTIKGDMTQQERREYAAVIAAEARRLKLLSSRLMELVSLQETELVLHPVNLKELTEKAVEVFTPVCVERQCAVRSRLLSIWVRADEALLMSLLLNLLDNALKASEPGQQIEIIIKKAQTEAVIQVQDQGIGIPRDQLEHVTEAFYMVDKARSRKSGGSGIGLSLCKAIAQAHHGTLEIESRQSGGTRVTLRLPAQIPAEESRQGCFDNGKEGPPGVGAGV